MCKAQFIRYYCRVYASILNWNMNVREMNSAPERPADLAGVLFVRTYELARTENSVLVVSLVEVLLEKYHHCC